MQRKHDNKVLPSKEGNKKILRGSSTKSVVSGNIIISIQNDKKITKYASSTLSNGSPNDKKNYEILLSQHSSTTLEGKPLNTSSGSKTSVVLIRSNRRRGNRRCLAQSASVRCSHCGKMKVPHRVCGNCGYYNGRKIIEID